jgi:ribonuclease G
VLKEPLGTKGARLTTYIAIPSRYLVLTPHSVGIGVSSRIEDETERERLRCVVEELKAAAPAAGYIIRTAAEGATREALEADLTFLHKLWQSIEENAAKTPAAAAARAARLVEPRYRARARRFRGDLREAQGIRRAVRAAA